MKEARRDQTRLEIARLRAELDDWLALRNAKDIDHNGAPRGQYDSQLQAIHDAVAVAAKVIADDLHNADLNTLSVGEAYARCAQYDQLIIWLWRVFGFFRAKFDQRDDPILQNTLRAADDVLWSCYKPFFQKPKMAGRRGAPPLPYIETEYSPLAVSKKERPLSLELKIKFEPLKKTLDELPVAIMRLPTSTVTAGWSLALIGHETGHFVQPAVPSNYTKSFAEMLARAVEKAAGKTSEQDNWYAWAPEVFADWYSVILMGPWAAWVMAQFEIKDSESMLKPRKSYPSPLVRLKLLSTLASSYVPSAGKILAPLDLESYYSSEDEVKDLKFVAAVCEEITGSELPDGLGKMSDLLNFRPEEFEEDGDDPRKENEVGAWASALLGRAAKTNDQHVRTARLVAAGAARAWSEIMRVEDPDQRRDAARALNQTVFARIVDNGELGKRGAAAQEPGQGAQVGAAVGKLLLEIDPALLREEGE